MVGKACFSEMQGTEPEWAKVGGGKGRGPRMCPCGEC